ETSPLHAAYMEDRIRVHEGRPQRYGSQFDWNEAGTAIEPMVGVEHPDGVDARRAAIGLPPIRWRHEPLPRESAPADPAGRRAEYEAGLRRTGWRWEGGPAPTGRGARHPAPAPHPPP